jgi:hypothetical protein
MNRYYSYRGFVIGVESKVVQVQADEGHGERTLGFMASIQLTRPGDPGFELPAFEVGSELGRLFPIEADVFQGGYAFAIGVIDEAFINSDPGKVTSSQARHERSTSVEADAHAH